MQTDYSGDQRIINVGRLLINIIILIMPKLILQKLDAILILLFNDYFYSFFFFWQNIIIGSKRRHFQSSVWRYLDVR